MKFPALLAFIILFNLDGKSEVQVDSFQNIKLKRGVYFSFEEIKNQNPSFFGPLVISERTKRNILLMGGGKYVFESSAMTTAIFKRTKKYFIGVSDGEAFYISDKLTGGGVQGMTKCLLSGPFLVAPIQGNAAQYTGGGIIPSLIKVGQGFLINVNTGISDRISEQLLKSLLKKYPRCYVKYKRLDSLLEFTIPIINDINKEITQ